MHMTVVPSLASYGAAAARSVPPRRPPRRGVSSIGVIPRPSPSAWPCRSTDALAHDDAVRGVLERMLMRLARRRQAFSGAVTPPQIVDDRSFLRATEDVIRERCAAGSGVILGRAAAVVLRDRPARCTCASTGGRPPAGPGDGARRDRPRDAPSATCRETDRAREAYVPAVLRRRRARRPALPPGHRLDRAGARRLRPSSSPWPRRPAATGGLKCARHRRGWCRAGGAAER